MVFSSPTFLFVFLPVVLAGTWLLPPAGRRIFLLLASFAFYAWGAQGFAIVVAASTLLDWALALRIASATRRGASRAARAWLLIGLAQNLALLGWFKYAGFASLQADRLGHLLGLDAPGPLSVVLPIGISFFTFEKVSYLVDVRRGDVDARRNPIDLLLFVALFPRSIAGPIVRLREIQDDLTRPMPTADLRAGGAVRFSHGLAKKVLVADSVAPIADAAFAAAAAGTLTTEAAWLGAIAFALQLYFDFSGYSDMAIGIGMMLGFRFPENFDRPYSAVSMTDFWRRWHMTLSRWFRDYLFIPLGGSRGSAASTSRNLVIVFLLTGLWHGAAWTFLLWGAYHGSWLLIERRFGWRGVDGPVRHAWFRRATTLLIVVVGWVIFRAESLTIAADFYRAMIVPTGGGLTPDVEFAATNRALVVLALAALVVLLPRRRNGGRLLLDGTTRAIAATRVAHLLVLLPFTLAMALASSSSPFLYFQF